MAIFKYLYTSIFLGFSAFAIKFPDNFERCHLSNPNLSSCLDKAIENALQILGKGPIPSLHLKGVEPIQVARVTLQAGTSTVRFVQYFFDVGIYGFSKATVHNTTLDMENKMISFILVVPEIQQKSKYEIDGKILVLPLKGKGDAVITLRGVHANHTIRFKEETKENKRYFHIDKYTIDFNCDTGHYDLTNLFDGDENLAKNVLNTLNDNWPSVFSELKHHIDINYAEVSKHVSEGLFNNVPFDEIIPK